MRVALVVSCSFGAIVQVGETILKEGGFEICRIHPEERPLDVPKMHEIVSREDPDVIICRFRQIDESHTGGPPRPCGPCH